MPMPSAWVDRIVDKLTLTYGHRFMSQWPGMSLEAVKANWAHELDGMERHPEAIKHALSNLDPDYPPNVLQFKRTCNSLPHQDPIALPAPPADPEKLAQAIAKAKQATSHFSKFDHMTPIRSLMYRELQGDRSVNEAQRGFWRIALADEVRKKYGINTREKFSINELAAAVQAKGSA